MKDHLIAGIDIGSSAIRLAIGQVFMMPDKRPSLNIIGAAEVESQGISKGVVSSLEDVVTAISGCLEQAERQVGLPVSEAYVGIGGTFTNVQLAKGVIGVSRSDGEIRDEDIQRALESARSVVNPANYEILHVLPKVFLVDGQSGIKDPLGMQGIRLEVEAHIVQGLSTHVRNLTKAVFRTNLDISELVFIPLAASQVVTSPRQREVGVAVVNIGGATTSVAVYEDGELLHAVVIPLGSDHITQDIAIVLRTSLEVAEQVKRAYISADASQIDQHDVLDLREVGAEQSEVVSPRFISDIAQARAEEIFEKVQQELKKINRGGMLPAGVILTGGGVKLRGMVDLAKNTLRLPVGIAALSGIQTPLTEIMHDPAFSTAIGLVVWGFEGDPPPAPPATPAGTHTPTLPKGGAFMKKVSSPLKKIFKSFMP